MDRKYEVLSSVGDQHDITTKAVKNHIDQIPMKPQLDFH